ncbi:pre-mRNA-splicing factor prp46 [Saitoella coloradoensis]
MLSPESQAELLLRRSAKRTRALFAESDSSSAPTPALASTTEDPAIKARITSKLRAEYEHVRELPAHIAAKQPGAKKKVVKKAKGATVEDGEDEGTMKMIEGIPAREDGDQSQALTIRTPGTSGAGAAGVGGGRAPAGAQHGLIRRSHVQPIKPEWHAPWKLMRVISGHLGWVRCVAVEPENQWFATGAGDRTIKIWDLASGNLKVTLTGHISTVRGLAVSPRHPYLFSCAEDKQIKCWDLEQNKVIRHYHGHLSGIYSLALHPTLDVLVTAGRDSVARVWDMRTRQNVMTLGGHSGTISDVKCQESDPQVLTGSMDSTVRLWDLVAGKAMNVLTHHKKSVRALAVHPTEWTFASGSGDNIKQWKCPEGAFMQNFEGHNAIINTLSVNTDNVLFSGADNGSMSFWDWKSGHRFQTMQTVVQPGSLESEAGVFASTFDRSGLRLITCEADKSIKIWGEDRNATPDTHPLDWKPTLARRKF